MALSTKTNNWTVIYYSKSIVNVVVVHITHFFNVSLFSGNYLIVIGA